MARALQAMRVEEETTDIDKPGESDAEKGPEAQILNLEALEEAVDDPELTEEERKLYREYLETLRNAK